MAQGNFAKLLKPLLGIEGGVADRSLKDDPGGLTNKGVTHAVYDAYRAGKGLPQRSVRQITNAEVEEIYLEQYWRPIRGDELPSGLDWAVFDFAVNSGPGRAIKELQRVLGCSMDGVVGMRTLKMIGQADLPTLIDHYCDRRLTFMQGLKNWGANKNGWTRRVAEVRVAALNMADPDTPEPTAAEIAPLTLPTSATAKAPEAATAVAKTPEAQGLMMLASGISGEKVRQAQDVAHAHSSMDTPLGRAAFVLFGALSVVGFVLVAMPWLKRLQQMGLFGGFKGSVFR